MATDIDPKINLLSLTDCIYFTNGFCTFKNKCHYRHCQTAMKQLEKCPNWSDSCRNINCPYRHTGTPSKAFKPVPQEKSLVVFFWDIENVSIPQGQKPFDIVQRIRQKLVIEAGLQEADFSCYCNSNTISQENQQNLHHATVRIVHVPDRKLGAVDRQIMLDLDRFERTHRPPATIVLISDDINFIGKLSDLRHQARFHVIVIHNKPAKEELKVTVNEHYPWELFTESLPQPLIQPVIRNNSERLTNPSPTFRPVSNDRLNNDSNVISAVSDKSKPPLIMPLRQSRGENILSHTNHLQSKPSTPHRHSGSVTRNRRKGSATRNRRPADHTQPLKPPINHSLNQIPTSNTSSNTLPPVPFPPGVVRPRMRQSNITNQLNRQNISISASCEQIPSTVDDNTAKISRIPLQCPYCTNEYSSIKALRQHQSDKKHLFDCPVCKEGFPTAAGLKQHQNAKGHNVTNDMDDHCNAQPDTADNLNIQQFATEFEHNLNTSAKNKCLPVHQNPVADYSVIDRGINNIN